ncbi:hypothetical protein ACWT_3179 [Actinoplanes sp. SE50]|uniref:hypothetical protein n=1 Tax=unclassified Actinoplanes TaxID=2626549 RepID=UPI00023EC7A4|nr:MULTISPECIES: hypothetical protein [unclassified Actinoplanes]AEV84202.1 hypothetical protein ACPL_3307 [Actinoplanes sp. SE50/110]ATO82594.1 hypothetical protein ACWT_3179 [Actinoplanes sp. SE50]SLM00001.1 hypothetical protein ACSP50_3233 [Actinoplanes sp. SE50/110]
MTPRTDLVIPADLVAGLDIPSLAVTDATPDPVWAPVPIGQNTFRRDPSQRLPLDPRTAATTMRHRRLAPWGPPALFGTLIIYWISLHRHDLPLAVSLAGLAVYLGTIVGWQRVTAGLPAQRPRRLPSGDLRIPKVPAEVAAQWTVRNPGVTVTDEPMPRPHSRRFYAGWAIGLLSATVLLVVVLAEDGREDDIRLWMLVPMLFVSGIVMAFRMRPPARGKPEYTLLG